MMNNGRAGKRRTGGEERQGKTKKAIVLVSLPCPFVSEGFFSSIFLE